MSKQVEKANYTPDIRNYLRKYWIDHRERISEWYRMKFHTIAVTILMFLNLLLAYSGLIIYLSHLKHAMGEPEIALYFLFNTPPPVLVFIMDMFFIPLDKMGYGWMLLALNLALFNWLYSTITQPIKRGYKTIINWRSSKGRVWALILSAIPFMIHYSAIICYYVDSNIFDFFAAIRSPKPYLMVNSMESFGYILMFLPVFLCIVSIYAIGKQFYINEDLQNQFYTWEFPLLSRQSFSLKDNSCDVIIGWVKKTGKPIIIKETIRYLHELIVGTTGSGKTSTTILIRIVQDLIRIARGKKMGIVLLEPKGDAVRDVIKLATALGIPKKKIKVIDPTNLSSVKFNPFYGPMESASETFKGTLNALAGDQDVFFKGQQEETAGFYTLLGKLRYAEHFNISHIQQMYTDPRYLANITEEVRRKIDEQLQLKSLTDAERRAMMRYDGIVRYFEDEILDYKTFRKQDEVYKLTYPEGHRYAGLQVVENKKDKFVTGGKKYLNEIALNELLSHLFIPKDGDEVIDLDKFLDEGGILLVNTALGELDELSLMFGQFFIRQFQSAVFRRPPEEDEEGNPTGYKRIPNFFYIDEFPLYINEAFVRFLTLGRSFKNGVLIALQSLGQLDNVQPGYDKIIKNSARNRTAFGGGTYEDNEWFSKQFGEENEVEESLNESTTPVTVESQSWGYRHNTQRSLKARFTPTEIMELPFKHFICQLVDEDNNVLKPILSYGKFVSETKFIKKFLNVAELKLQSEKERPLDITSHLQHYSYLLSSLVTDSKTKVEENTSDNFAQKKKKLEEETPSQKDESQSSEVKTVVPEKEIQALVKNEEVSNIIPWPIEDDLQEEPQSPTINEQYSVIKDTNKKEEELLSSTYSYPTKEMEKHVEELLKEAATTSVTEIQKEEKNTSLEEMKETNRSSRVLIIEDTDLSALETKKEDIKNKMTAQPSSSTTSVTALESASTVTIDVERTPSNYEEDL
ncbi:hypothetical protein AM501_23975 [Aneurinibacillus migulanus]|uniref:TraM recognition domain-containing protein n=1 Tax=Aneurinibacillus migulanus TaxID=47500 RepID=UPI0005BBE015|nr:TraM recognition domain-containing protein [Aneurinibacillus migulanus]KIV58933.1 hypothetical protein TS64_04005 [Aneurinibacillus migulanus]KPD05835.1 hypothetical protein AM501_23975 [Aneurinibacillus migulanus]